ncbi:putative uncharacterized protein [Eubacterium sp. CAG:841]|nr:putative uncharacterized protein [Eubacterium sp. CAG:841]
MALQDKIGREEFVDKICGLVDFLKKDKNFCLAINGAWGSGKSFVLGLIEEKLSKKQEYIIIKYDAWENTFYSDPLIAILSCVIDGIEEKLYLVERTEEKVKKAAKTGVNTLAKLSTKIEKLKAVIEGIKTIIKDFHNPIDTEALGDFKSYQKLLKATKEILNEITQAGEYREKQTKLIIIVDEIDRCLPDEQLKILERLHHLFDVKNCAVIVTMNQTCVAETVKTIYGIDGYEYLRKFFNYTFRLDTSANEYLKNLFSGYIKNFDNLQISEDKVEFSVKLAYQCLLYGSEKALDKADNRELTRYFECVMNVCNDFGWQNLNRYDVFFVLLALYIRKIISPNFLNPNEIAENQSSIFQTYKNLPDDRKRCVMPYYDYLAKFLGADRERSLPKEIDQLYCGMSNFDEFSWAFNETVYFSMAEQFRDNELRRFIGDPIVKPDACKELCRLVILYGGEQEKCER